ncbi:MULTISPECIES: ribosome maturation factor [unclassified Thermosipho (in: thermotogales)]|uniref:ribosome maturation factor RimP n=1 Tax=unclassified Thermosipho (in: thermotogales) TaxID=2676525 RepID=UPI000949476E|nr:MULTISPECIES: ribosome maturation factor [unclassified Thermosipho (in: thermotogales)]ANQ54317.1 ribosome maturation factor RimP [Thermosipho sp. 1070]APT72762.1 ribosome maturation factor RimP [Thermosipho sp. 1063]MBT1247436.1 ribosome maturation factor RimP [Thermosipho sp. 1244]OOC42152.1 ribosome maturation factor RimP [Thermosipho sp. 1074]OOC46313.1 ribosome maturation factor RimP [Thermosipho sp. 1223]
MRDIVSQVKKISEKICKELQLELFDVKYYNKSGRWFLEVIIDNPYDYVSTKDCEKVSRALEYELDKIDIIPSKYYLTVSSPGLDRPLRNINDFERFINHKVKIKTQTNSYIGYIKNIKNNIITIDVNGKKIEIKFEEIKNANLEIDF